MVGPIQGNHKQYMLLPFAWMGPDKNANNQAFICNICKKYWDNNGASVAFLAHLIADHGYSDAG